MMELTLHKEIGTRRIEGHYRKIEPTATRRKENGTETIRYGYAETGGHFLRPDVCFVLIVRSLSDGLGRVKDMTLGRIDWFSLSDADEVYSQMLSKGRVAAIRETFHPTDKELGDFILRVNGAVERCLQTFRTAYRNSEEYRAVRENRERIHRWNKAKERFDRVYGAGWFEQIYNFDLELVNVELLEKLRRNHHDGQSEENAGQADTGPHSSAYAAGKAPQFSTQDISYLKKFYRILARQYHPDVSHDDGRAMQLLNRLKEFFGL